MRGGLRVSPGGKRHHLHDRLICVYCKLIKKLTVGNAREEGYIISTLFVPSKPNHDSLLIEMRIFAWEGCIRGIPLYSVPQHWSPISQEWLSCTSWGSVRLQWVNQSTLTVLHSDLFLWAVSALVCNGCTLVWITFNSLFKNGNCRLMLLC